MKVILLAAMVVSWAGSVACQAAPLTSPTVCSAFDQIGDEATAIFSNGKGELRLLPASGHDAVSFSLSSNPDKGQAFTCNIFFDRAGRYMAVGMEPVGLNHGPLNIFVGNLTTKKLIGSFSVSPSVALGASVALIGFLRDSSSLVVLGNGTPATRSFSVTLFSVTGEQDAPPEKRMPPEDAGSVGNTHWIDAVHNRVWLKSKEFHCPLRSISLVGGEQERLQVDNSEADAACDAAIAVAYPDADTIITAATRGDTDPVTHIDLLQHTVQQVDLLPPKGSYTSVSGGSLSPDAQFFAVSRQILSLSFFGDTRFHGTEIDVVQVSPLKVVGTFHLAPTADGQSIAIDHRNGAITMLSFDFKSGVWKSQLLKLQ